jgi:hypothetical protein
MALINNTPAPTSSLLRGDSEDDGNTPDNDDESVYSMFSTTAFRAEEDDFVSSAEDEETARPAIHGKAETLKSSYPLGYQPQLSVFQRVAPRESTLPVLGCADAGPPPLLHIPPQPPMKLGWPHTLSLSSCETAHPVPTMSSLSSSAPVPALSSLPPPLASCVKLDSTGRPCGCTVVDPNLRRCVRYINGWGRVARERCCPLLKPCKCAGRAYCARFDELPLVKWNNSVCRVIIDVNRKHRDQKYRDNLKNKKDRLRSLVSNHKRSSESADSS